MIRENKSATPSEASRESVSFGPSPDGNPSRASRTRRRKNWKIESELCRSAAHILHATSYKSRMSQVRRASLQRRQKPKPAEWNYM